MPLTETISAVVTAIATFATAGVAVCGYRRITARDKPVLDLDIKNLGSADNVLEARLTVRNPGRTTIVVECIRLLKTKFSEGGVPEVGIASEETLHQTALPQTELREPFQIEPAHEGRKNFSLFLYQRHGHLVEIKLGVDVQYIGTKLKTERITIKRKIRMPQPR